MRLVRVEHPAQANVGGAHLDKEQYDAENHGEVHKSECAHESEECDDMVPNHLLVVGGESSNDHDDVEGVLHEVATGVHEGPNVQVARRVEALVIIEDSLAVTADAEHCQH